MDILKRMAALFNRNTTSSIQKVVSHCQRHPDYRSCLTTWENAFVECLLQTWRKLPDFKPSGNQSLHLTEVLAKLDACARGTRSVTQILERIMTLVQW
jgi:hypothetical protein